MHRTVTAAGKAIRLALVALIMASYLSLYVCVPSAQAMEVAKCTAKPNADSGSDVLGGTETRITWEGQCAAEESLTSVSLVLPEGTTYSLDDARLTVLTGADLMTRENPQVTWSQEGQTVTATLAEAPSDGCYVRVEIFGVFFPTEGGSFTLTGTYVNAAGETLPISDIPAINVTGISPTEQLGNWLDEQPWVKAWNSVKFLHLFLNPSLLVTSFPTVFGGFLMALAIIVVAFPLAIPFGLLLSLMRISKNRFLNFLASIYVNVVRGTPVFLQIYIAFFGLPLAGVVIPNFPLGVIVLAFNSAAYQCEIFRAGIQSIHRGQFEAARSLGMNGAQTMIHVIIPQMVRRVIPTMTNEFILLYKDTSMLAAVGVMEIVMYSKSIVAATGSITPYIVAACFYLVITLPMAKVVGILERKLDMDSKQGAPSKKKRGLFGKKEAVGALEAESAPEAPQAAAAEPAEAPTQPALEPAVQATAEDKEAQ